VHKSRVGLKTIQHGHVVRAGNLPNCARGLAGTGGAGVEEAPGALRPCPLSRCCGERLGRSDWLGLTNRWPATSRGSYGSPGIVSLPDRCGSCHVSFASANGRHHWVAGVDSDFQKTLATATPVHGMVRGSLMGFRADRRQGFITLATRQPQASQTSKRREDFVWECCVLISPKMDRRLLGT